MSDEVDRNKAVLNRFWSEVWDQGNLDVVDEIFHENFVDHGLAPGLTKQGPEGAKEAVMQFRTAMPDLYLRCDMMVAEGDKVLSVWESGGTQTGPLSSARGTIPPTGNRGVVRGMTLNRVEDGKIIEAWDNFDILGMLMQLGVIPAGGPAPAAAGGDG
ncbi:MAG TPA: ester cyclase [Thermoleophilaceae bacterium]|jgi:predicted ester cyclase